jgi:hypothetical protein
MKTEALIITLLCSEVLCQLSWRGLAQGDTWILGSPLLSDGVILRYVKSCFDQIRFAVNKRNTIIVLKWPVREPAKKYSSIQCGRQMIDLLLFMPHHLCYNMLDLCTFPTYIIKNVKRQQGMRWGWGFTYLLPGPTVCSKGVRQKTCYKEKKMALCMCDYRRGKVKLSLCLTN